MKKTSIGILLDKNNRVLLIKRSYTKECEPNKWALPGGRGEEGENHIQIVIREVKEEVGLDFIPTKLIEEVSIIDKNVSQRFIGTWSGKIVLQEEECDGYGWFSIDEILKMDIGFDHKECIKKLF